MSRRSYRDRSDSPARRRGDREAGRGGNGGGYMRDRRDADDDRRRRRTPSSRREDVEEDQRERRRSSHRRGEPVREREEKERKVPTKAQQAAAASIKEGVDDMEVMKLLGLPVGFDSTSGKEIDDKRAHLHGANIVKQRQYRQYMNRNRRGPDKMLDSDTGV